VNRPAETHERLLPALAGVGALRACGLILSLATVVTLARVLGPAEFGTYAYVLALVSLAGMPIQLGLPALVVRETARAQQDSRWQSLKGLWRWSYGVVALMSTAVIVAALVGLALSAGRFSDQLAGVLLWGLAILPLAAWGNLQGAALTGLCNTSLGQLPENVLRPGILLSLILGGMLLFRSFEPRAMDAMALNALAAVLSLLIGACLLRLNRPTELRSARPSYQHGTWFAAVWPLSLVAGMHVVNRHTDIVILGFFVPADEVGVYRVAAQAATLVSFSLQIVNMAIAPHFARLYSARKLDRLQQLVTAGARWTIAGAVPASLLLIIFGEGLLSLIFGEEYGAGALALSILAIGQLVNAGAGSVGLLLNMSGHERVNASSALLATLLNIVLNLALVPRFGITGAASATAASLIIWNIVLCRAVRNRIGVDSTAFGFARTERPT